MLLSLFGVLLNWETWVAFAIVAVIIAALLQRLT